VFIIFIYFVFSHSPEKGSKTPIKKKTIEDFKAESEKLGRNVFQINIKHDEYLIIINRWVAHCNAS